MKEYTTAEFTDFSTPQQAIPQWQLCPKCNGNGMLYTMWDGVGLFSTCCTCDLCNGHKVISVFTGKPPLL